MRDAWCVYILSNNAHWTRAKKVALIQRTTPNWIDVTPEVLELLRLK